VSTALIVVGGVLVAYYVWAQARPYEDVPLIVGTAVGCLIPVVGAILILVGVLMR
jgi:hypothetical protein